MTDSLQQRTLLSFAVCLIASVVSAQQVEWQRQLGQIYEDESRSIDVDLMGNVFVAGDTGGSLAAPHAGDFDAFVAKYDSAGNLAWTRQFGTDGRDRAFGVASDSTASVYVAGYTEGVIGAMNFGEYDGLIGRYDPSGNLLWLRQFGTSGWDLPRGVATDAAGNAYLAGGTRGNFGAQNKGDYDVFLTKYDAAGNQLWVRQYGSSGHDESYGVASDGLGHIYLSGFTTGNLAGSNAGANDVFVSKFTESGDLLWTRQFGTSGNDDGTRIAADTLGNVYIAGQTDGNLGETNAGMRDMFISKWDALGEWQWTKLLGTPVDERADAEIDVDELGNVYVSGRTTGDLFAPNSGAWDAFIARFDSHGNLTWGIQGGTSQSDWPGGVAVDGAGTVYLTGGTYGALAGEWAGNYDVFLIKYGANVPEPRSLEVMCVAIVGLYVGATRRSRFLKSMQRNLK